MVFIAFITNTTEIIQKVDFIIFLIFVLVMNLGAMVFINGAWVLAPLGGAIGYFAAKKLAKNKKQKFEQEKIKKYGEEINNQTRKNKK